MLSEVLFPLNKLLLQDGVLPQSHLQQDDDLAHAISLSLKVLDFSFY